MPGFVGYLIRTETDKTAEAMRDLTGRMYLTLDMPQSEFNGNVERMGFKLALRIAQEQQIDEFSYRGAEGREVRLRADRDVAEDATRVFPPDPGQKWTGFVAEAFTRPDFQASNVAVFGLRLRLSGARRPARQLVPAVIRYNNKMSFADGHLAGVWALPPAR